MGFLPSHQTAKEPSQLFVRSLTRWKISYDVNEVRLSMLSQSRIHCIEVPNRQIDWSMDPAEKVFLLSTSKPTASVRIDQTFCKTQNANWDHSIIRYLGSILNIGRSKTICSMGPYPSNWAAVWIGGIGNALQRPFCFQMERSLWSRYSLLKPLLTEPWWQHKHPITRRGKFCIAKTRYPNHQILCCPELQDRRECEVEWTIEMGTSTANMIVIQRVNLWTSQLQVKKRKKGVDPVCFRLTKSECHRTTLLHQTV